MSLEIPVGKLQKPKAGSGAPSITNARDVIAIPVEAFPDNFSFQTDEKGVRMLNNFVLKDGFYGIPFYSTPDTKEYTSTAEGEQDQENFKLQYKSNFPGGELEATEFAVNYNGKGFVLVVGKCIAGGSRKVLGSPCFPLILKSNFTANKDKTGFEFTFAQSTGSRSMHYEYFGDVETEDSLSPEQPSTAVEFLEENTNVVKIAKGTAASEIAITTVEKANDAIVTLVGQDLVPANAATLESATEFTGSVIVLLKDGLDWVSNQSSTISFRVMKDATKTWLVETARS